MGGENVMVYDVLRGIKTWDENIDLISRGWKKTE